MISLSRTALSLALAGALLAPAGFAAPLTRSDVDAAIKAYIATHGDEIAASVESAKTRQEMARLEKMITPQTPVRGPASAPITIFEFIDMECPYCASVQPTIKAIDAKYPGKVRWVFKALPLDFHRHARPAVYAALAAGKQGKFFEFVEAVFPQQDKLGDALYLETAKKLKLNVKKFNADRASAAVAAQVNADLKDAEESGARGTPYFIVNGQGLSGALPPEAFFKIIDATLTKK